MWWSALRPIAKDASNRQAFENVKGVQQITRLFEAIHVAHHKRSLEEMHMQSVDALHRAFGFRLSIQPSTLQGAGNGVYLKGVREQGEIVSLYPGTFELDSQRSL